MPVSDSYDYELDRNDIFEEALLGIGALGQGNTASAFQIKRCANGINQLIQSWQGPGNLSPGLEPWARKTATLFLQKDQVEYQLGPSGDNCTASFVETTLTADSAASDLTLDVTSDTDIASADLIGILMDNGTIHWDVVNGAPAANVVTITTGMAALATSGATVYAYTTKIMRPTSIIVAMARSSDTEDLGMAPYKTREDYESIIDKNQAGTPNRYYYEGELVDGRIYFNFAPDDLANYTKVRMVIRRPFSDFDAATDTADFPPKWHRAIKWNLMLEIAPMFSKPVTPQMERNAINSLLLAQQAEPEEVDMHFQPDRTD